MELNKMKKLLAKETWPSKHLRLRNFAVSAPIKEKWLLSFLEAAKNLFDDTYLTAHFAKRLKRSDIKELCDGQLASFFPRCSGGK
jgi:hypothetical protein